MLALLIVACTSRSPLMPAAPNQPQPAQAAIHHCALPPVPEIPVAVGYPDAHSIYVTTSDLEALTKALTRMKAWMQAAAACLGS